MDSIIQDFAEKKRIKLFERLLLFACIVGMVHFFPDLIIGTKEAPIFDLTLSAFTFGCYILHRKGFHTTSRILVLSFLNLFLTIYACVMSKEVGIYLYFLPLMALSIAVFSYNQRLLRWSFAILSGVLLASLFISDFNLIGSIQFETANEDTFYMINIISCAFSLVVCIHFIVSINEESERRLHDLAEEVKTKNNNLEKTNAELDRFLYSTSHDLRAPLLSIKGLVNIARNEAIRPEVKKYLSMIEERADRLDFFIRDIIDYSRNSRTDLSWDVVNMPQLVEEVQKNFQFLEGASKIDFQNDIFQGNIIVDRSRLMIVLNNLISNAIKYHQFHPKNPWIKTSAAVSGNILTLVVADNGQGIHPDRKERVFEMFYRGTERSQGSGLGLYIVKEAIDKMKGTIQLESTEGIGTSFFVAIPINAVETASLPEPTAPQQKEPERDSVVEAV